MCTFTGKSIYLPNEAIKVYFYREMYTIYILLPLHLANLHNASISIYTIAVMVVCFLLKKQSKLNQELSKTNTNQTSNHFHVNNYKSRLNIFIAYLVYSCDLLDLPYLHSTF